jgi:hypothetical protein
MIKQQQTPRHSDWKIGPVNNGTNTSFQTNGIVAYITGTGKDGKRYCRTVELPSVESEAVELFDKVFALVWALGPSVCKEFPEGGDLPSEAEMPLLGKV